MCVRFKLESRKRYTDEREKERRPNKEAVVEAGKEGVPFIRAIYSYLKIVSTWCGVGIHS